MLGSSFITLKREALQNNIRFLKKKLGDNVRISSVVKANAYGHGIEQIVPMFEEEGINHFSVFDFGEAVRVQNSLKNNRDIMIMGWIADENIVETIKRGIEFYIFNMNRLSVVLEVASEIGIKAKIHLEVETGMNRSGLTMKELEEAISIIKENPQFFEIKGFCTHLAGAESISNHVRIQKQLKTYHKLHRILIESGITPEYRHVANSAAAFVYPKSRLDMVRIGIMQYGFWSSIETFLRYTHRERDPLQRVLGWRSQIMSIKEVKKGEFVGYGISFLAQSNMKTALIPVGYSVGYSRSLSNRGRVLINGHRCGIIGMVNMNMIIANVTELPDVKVDDDVVIIGMQGKSEIKVSAFSNISDSLNYEILTHLPNNVERVII
ncbi:alanine racemase [Marinifilum flexuosum]|uniref:Alanine racemase n=1 Tax=Marinifilum flexuosum TaxID=1117708 RepID=A0A419X8Z5_9BACT|nr:alanine racemase [Marinifilum flexuosum]RKE04126.1 alanine racemase [Marinifilum flexuosum]